VTWAPGGGRLDWSWSEGRLVVKVPRLEVHGAIVVGN
jgi:hypothetical protein